MAFAATGAATTSAAAKVPKRPLALRVGKNLRRIKDHIVGSSRAPNDSVLARRSSTALRDNWRFVATAILVRSSASNSFASGQAQKAAWEKRSHDSTSNLARFPRPQAG
jgi:hypothetical protein